MMLPRLELFPSRPFVCSDAPTVLDLLVRIHAPDAAPRSGGRRPLNLAFVVDKSGSMAGAKLEAAKEAVRTAVSQLRPDDTAALISYDDQVSVDHAAAPVGDGRALLAAVDAIELGGSTALYDGWLAGAEQAAGALRDDALNRVLLLSDGQANAGLTDPSAIAEHVRGLASRGVSTSALGIGRDFDERLMQVIADAGDGTYYFIEDPAALPTFFEAELSGLNATVGTSVRMRFSRAKGVRLGEMLTDLPHDTTVRIDRALTPADGGVHGLAGLVEQPARWKWSVLPPMTSGHTFSALLRLIVPPQTDAATVALGDLVLSWIPAGEQRRVAALLDTLELDAVPQAEWDAVAEHPDVVRERTRQESGRLSAQAEEQVRSGDLAAARLSLEAAVFPMRIMRRVDPSVAGEIAALEQAASALDDGDAVRAAKSAHNAGYLRRRSRK